MISYHGAWDLFSTARFFHRGKPIGNNTYLHREKEDFCIYLHGNKIITIRKDNTYMIQAGFHKSRTTRKRINAFTPVNLYQRNWEWYFTDPQSREEYKFYDGLVFDKHGSCIAYEGGEPLDERLRKMFEAVAERRLNEAEKPFHDDMNDGFIFAENKIWARYDEYKYRPAERIANGTTFDFRVEQVKPKEIPFHVEDVGWIDGDGVIPPSPEGFKYRFIGTGVTQEDAVFDAIDQASVAGREVPSQVHDKSYSSLVDGEDRMYFFVLYL